MNSEINHEKNFAKWYEYYDADKEQIEFVQKAILSWCNRSDASLVSDIYRNRDGDLAFSIRVPDHGAVFLLLVCRTVRLVPENGYIRLVHYLPVEDLDIFIAINTR